MKRRREISEEVREKEDKKRGMEVGKKRRQERRVQVGKEGGGVGKK